MVERRNFIVEGFALVLGGVASVLVWAADSLKYIVHADTRTQRRETRETMALATAKQTVSTQLEALESKLQSLRAQEKAQLSKALDLRKKGSQAEALVVMKAVAKVRRDCKMVENAMTSAETQLSQLEGVTVARDVAQSTKQVQSALENTQLGKMASTLMDMVDETADRNDDLQEVTDAMAEMGAIVGGGDDDSSDSALLAELDEMFHDVELGQLPPIPQEVSTSPPVQSASLQPPAPAEVQPELQPEPEPQVEHTDTEVPETTPMLA